MTAAELGKHPPEVPNAPGRETRGEGTAEIDSGGRRIGSTVTPAGDIVTRELDLPVQCRSMADRREAAARLPPLRDGRRDPDSRYPADAPDERYRLWLLAEQLADTPVPPSGDR